MVLRVAVLVVPILLEDLVVEVDRVLVEVDLVMPLNHHKTHHLLLIPTLLNTEMRVDLYPVQVETIHLMVVVALAALEILTPTTVLVEMVVRADKSLQHLETHQIHMEEQVQVLLMDGLVAVVVDQTQPTEVLPLMDLPLELVVRVLTEQLLTLVEVAQDKPQLQVQQPSIPFLDMQTPEVVVVEVKSFREPLHLLEIL
jgi:hypothetical protein|tara:strand:+ start:284 stop:880 length:597 start_codon:yes stop_codon:yes gene_type:complete